MKLKQNILILAGLLVGHHAMSQNKSVYTIGIKDVNQKEIKLSDYKGKKLMIVVFDMSKTDGKIFRSLMTLDSLYKIHKNKVELIGVPMIDNGCFLTNDKLDTFCKKSLAISFPITEGSKTKKANRHEQSPLTSYLTDKQQNGHFDEDIEDGTVQLFVFNEKGELFATLNINNRRLSLEELKALVNKKDL